MTCPGFLDRSGGHGGVVGWEPHHPQPSRVLGGGHQFSEGNWRYMKERAYSYADSHVEWESFVE
jgi:hypothetical protein